MVDVLVGTSSRRRGLAMAATGNQTPLRIYDHLVVECLGHVARAWARRGYTSVASFQDSGQKPCSTQPVDYQIDFQGCALP